MSSQSKKQNSEVPNNTKQPIQSLLSTRVSRRRVLKASLIGAGGLVVAAKGLVLPEILTAAPSGGGGWRQLAPKTTPGPRSFAAMASDAARRMIVLFSGAGVNDTWTWDGLVWTRQTPPLSPPPRPAASFADHPPTQTLVLFGGVGSRGPLDDTWLWNGKTWRPAPGAGPPPRFGASMAFDPVRGSIILFGGFGDGPLGDTWEWNGTTWRALSPMSSPGPLNGAGLAFSAALGKLILFGGNPGMGNPENTETWAWYGSNWLPVPLNTSPPGRFDAAMAGSLDGRTILLFGGSGRELLGDTWVFTNTWVQSTQAQAPPPRTGASLAPDPTSNSLLLFGGTSGSGQRMGDIWAWGP